jgi:predicted nucleic acid-binding protein
VIYLLDTSAWLAHYREETGGERVQALFDDSDAQIMIAAVSLAEFARRLRDLGASRQQITNSLSGYEQLFSRIVQVDETVALAAFEIICRTRQRLPLVDAIIAAAALSQGAYLVHRDEHMRAIPRRFVRQKDLDSAKS